MIAISSRATELEWGTVSFASTLYLCPILDLLLKDIPARWKSEIRLGLQEALVNAAKHGNDLDPRKQVSVRYSKSSGQHWWIISDQGGGFAPPTTCSAAYDLEEVCSELSECGRGLQILYQIFDEVQWNTHGTELRLGKILQNCKRAPLIE